MSAVQALIILQARFGSSRLPGKVLAELDGVALVVHCLRRLSAAAVGEVCLATTTRADDDEVAAAGHREGTRVFRGGVDDVLGRFAAASAGFAGAFVIRATADNPAVDIEAAARVLEHLAGGADYVVETGLPYGCAVEGIRLDVMRQADTLAVDAHDREHVTPWIKARPDAFRVVTPPAPGALARPDLRFTIDTPADLAYMRRVLREARAGASTVALHDIIAAADRVAQQDGAA
ncbi:MAG: spore coat protein [Acidobacteria bacterium]|nr:spore coat protein [Acidobacteriota bacterium]